MRLAVLCLALCGCAASESVRETSEAARPAVEAVRALAEASKPTVEAVRDLAIATKPAAEAVPALAGEVRALTAKFGGLVDRVTAFLDRGPAAVDRARKAGVPVDEGPLGVLTWGARHPGEAVGLGGSFLAALAWAVVRGRRAVRALRAVTSTVEGADEPVRSAVKGAMDARFGSDRAIRAAIRAAKGTR